MNTSETCSISCPYCGESFDVLVDCSLPEQHYIEDCQVCCQPINFSVVVVSTDDISIRVSRDDE